MKCPMCSSKQNFKAGGMTCQSCGYEYKVDPKSSQPNDGFIVAAARNVSGDGTYHFTTNQVITQLDRKMHKKSRRSLLVRVAILVGGVVAAFVFANPVILVVSGIALVAVIINLLARPEAGPPRLIMSVLEALPEESSVAGLLITKPTLHEPPPEWGESDIYDYGVERILIVERDELVDLFVLNGWHSENRALVVSMSGYPDYITERVSELLDESPDLPVFVLHDSTFQGVDSAEWLQESDVFDLADRQLIDMGLTPSMANRMNCIKRLSGKLRNSGEVPVDYIPYGQLSALVARRCSMTKSDEANDGDIDGIIVCTDFG